eukprot:Sdes_comp10022_c0_seq1m1609
MIFISKAYRWTDDSDSCSWILRSMTVPEQFQSPPLDSYTHVILDIEGTTTKISFVHNVLFPYVVDNCRQYIEENWTCAELQNDIQLLRQQSQADRISGTLKDVIEIPAAGPCSDQEIIDKTVKNILWQMSFDRKINALKVFQGHMWRNGYQNGSLLSHIYSDVVPAMDSWLQAGKKIVIFSSGSVEAQKLLFGHTVSGDITPKISAYFDTKTAGNKLVSDSYVEICRQIHCPVPSKALFLTDNPQEAEAACKAGVNSYICCREENQPLSDSIKSSFGCFSSFSQFF